MRKDFIYIDNVVDGIVLVLEKDFNFEIFNIGNNDSVELKKFVNWYKEYNKIS